jgi:hypothetical protein
LGSKKVYHETFKSRYRFMSYSDCCSSDRLLTLSEAIAAALRSIQPIRETATVSLVEAYGRVLAADLPARLDVPPHDNSAMDGFALYLADLRSNQPIRLPVVGQVLVEHPHVGTAWRGGANYHRRRAARRAGRGSGAGAILDRSR